VSGKVVETRKIGIQFENSIKLKKMIGIRNFLYCSVSFKILITYKTKNMKTKNFNFTFIYKINIWIIQRQLEFEVLDLNIMYLKI